MNACDAVRELLAAQLLAALDEGQEALVEAHLGACAACVKERERTRAAVALVVAPAVEPPPAVWDKLRARLEHERGGDEPVRDVAEPGAVIAVSCSYCRGGLVRADTVYCASCLAPHHADCFAEHGRCSVMGCGETSVVQPSAAPRPRTPNGPRWRVVLGGLAAVCTGGAIAALTMRSPQPLPALPLPQPAPPTRVAEAPPAPLPAPPRLDVELRQATVGELCGRLEAVTGVKLHLPAEVAAQAAPEREWWDADWRDVLTDVAAADDLQLVEGSEGSAAPWAMLIPRQEGSRVAAAPALAWVDAAHLFAPEGPGRWTQTGLTEQAGARALVAPGGELLAVIGERRVRLFRGQEALSGLRLHERVLDAAWAQDGRELFLLQEGPGGQAHVLRLDAGSEGLRSVARVTLPAREGRPWQRVVPAGAGWALVEGAGRAVLVHVALPAPELHEVPLEGILACARLPVGVLIGTASQLHLAQPGGSVRSLGLDSFDVSRDEHGPSLALAPTPDGLHVLLREPLRARVVELEPAAITAANSLGLSARWGEATASHLPAWPWPGALSPDAGRLAWIDGRTLFWRPAAGRVEAGSPVLNELQGDPRGLAWRPDGGALAVWSDRAVCLLEPESGREELVHELPAAPGAIEDVQWVDARRFVVLTRLQRPRSPRVVVLPARPGETGWARPEREELLPAPLPAAPPAREEPGQEGSTPEPLAPHESPVEPPVEAPAPPRLDLSHVRAGQRWVFQLGTRAGERAVREEWLVQEIGGDWVRYERRVFLGAQQIGEAAQERWTPEALLTGEVRALGQDPSQRRRLGTLELSGLRLPVWIDRQPGTGVELWRAAGSDPQHRYTFPGPVRDLRDGQVQRELVRVE